LIDHSKFSSLPLLPKGKYFVKRGFCLLTNSVAASPELNKINIWLKEHSLGGCLYNNLEDYIVRLLFEVPKPFPPYKLKLYLPSIDTIAQIP
jgi:hypothetical protein